LVGAGKEGKGDRWEGFCYGPGTSKVQGSQRTYGLRKSGKLEPCIFWQWGGKKSAGEVKPGGQIHSGRSQKANFHAGDLFLEIRKESLSQVLIVRNWDLEPAAR